MVPRKVYLTNFNSYNYGREAAKVPCSPLVDSSASEPDPEARALSSASGGESGSDVEPVAGAQPTQLAGAYARSVPAPPARPRRPAHLQVSASGGAAAAFTTVMVKNIPYTYTTHALQRDVEAAGFANLYDFLYMPPDSRKTRCRGFAFVNFIFHDAAQAFCRRFHGVLLSGEGKDEKLVDVGPAAVQGFEANAFRHPAGVQRPTVGWEPAHEQAPARELGSGAPPGAPLRAPARRAPSGGAGVTMRFSL